ncbi:MAG TPA: hypothetical protein VF221_02885 [Chloroflexota bacterium]
MRRILAAILLGLAIGGCSSSSAPPKLTPTPSSAGPIASTTPSKSGPSPATAVPVSVDAGFTAFVHTVCTSLVRRDASTVIGLLPYYQYNSGLRYGMLGDGEGQTGDPSLLRTWLAGANIRCEYMSAGTSGHGTVLATGWPERGGTALIEMDTFSGHWKINDFTFGNHGALYTALQTVRPILRYRG